MNVAHQRLRGVAHHMGINAKRYLDVTVSGQILDFLDVRSALAQPGDVGVAEQVGVNVKVQCLGQLGTTAGGTGRDLAPADEGLMEERLVSAQELADQLGVSVNTIHRLAHKPDGLKGYKVGRLTRFRPSEVMAYLNQQEISGSAALSPLPGMRRFTYRPGMQVVTLKQGGQE